jgi:hypothetical protein
MDPILEWLRENGIEATVENVLALDYLGDVKSLAQLEENYPEDYAELMDYVREGRIKK